jgi:2-polyprenyl-3-methyl-5-hydroxy-6-metoxy-1,4-benzoquinol methylase
MRSIPFQEFKKIYEEKVNAISRYWTREMQKEMSFHCYGWDPSLFDIRNYLEASVIRYYTAYRAFAERGEGLTLCDVGGFWGVFPITLRQLGFEVTLTESLKYYGTSFEDLFDHIRAQGVRIVDYDPFKPGPIPGQYDIVTVMAILEHYPHSLRGFMVNVTSMMEQEGTLYIEVPNIAYWPKRMNLLLGRSPLVALQDIYRSETPFIGHHHEFTISELRVLAELSNIEIIKEFYYTYSVEGDIWRRFWRYPIEMVVQTFWPNTRECLAILCRKKKAAIERND